MKREHKAIIQKAQSEGKQPCEYAPELINFSLVETMRTLMSRYEVGLRKMSEAQQDATLAELQDEAKKISTTVAEILAGQGTKTVRMQLKDLKISNGQLVGVVSGEDPNFNELISKVQDKSGVLLVLYELDYHQAMDGIQSEKDQKSLPLDDEPAKAAKTPAVKEPKPKAPKKDIEIPAKQLNDARDFVTIQQNSSIAGLQNLLKCGYERANAILKVLEAEGLVVWVGTDEKGQYELLRGKPAGVADLPKFDAATLEVMYATACREVIKATSADDSVMRQVYGDDDNLIEQALMQMEEDGIVSKPSPEGLRDVLTLPV